MIREGITTIKYGTTCCALGILSANCESTIHEITWQVDAAKKSAQKVWKPDNRDGGETCLLCVTTPTEQVLETKLKTVGFKVIHDFNRRNGYPQNGKLKLWSLNLV